jgi:hypothetical protein
MRKPKIKKLVLKRLLTSKPRLKEKGKKTLAISSDIFKKIEDLRILMVSETAMYWTKGEIINALYEMARFYKKPSTDESSIEE